MPSCGAAALKAASSWPGTVTPSGRPAKAFGRAVGFQQPRRQPPEAGRGRASLSCGAPWAQFSCAIVILLSGWIATGKPPPLTETAISVDSSGVYWLGWGCVSSRRSLIGPSRVLKARPARRAFVFLGRLLLGGFPPLFDQLQQRLAAVAQTLALLELVNKGDGLARQRGDELVLSLRRQAAAIGAHVLSLGGSRRSPSCTVLPPN